MQTSAVAPDSAQLGAVLLVGISKKVRSVPLQREARTSISCTFFFFSSAIVAKMQASESVIFLEWDEEKIVAP